MSYHDYSDAAFPQPLTLGPNGGFHTPVELGTANVGLTRRELFAAMAMQGLLSNLAQLRKEDFRDRDIAAFAVWNADALIGELAKERP